MPAIRPRVIPCLLIEQKDLVKTVQFKKRTYLGDPINAVKIYNEKEVDELIILDIGTGKKTPKPDFEYIEQVVSESFMPIGYGGGVRTAEDANRLYAIGIEKVIFNTGAYTHPEELKKITSKVGGQSVVVSMDIKKNIFGAYGVYVKNGQKKVSSDPVAYARKMEELGVGELFVTAIDQEGTMTGYDVDLVKKIAEAVSIPVVANGGAGSLEDIKKVLQQGGVHAAAAGSIFVYHGAQKGVLINYPSLGRLESDLAQS